MVTVRGKGAGEDTTALGREALRVASELRRHMLDASPGPIETAVVMYNQGNTTKQLTAAAKNGCAAVVVVGEDEAERGTVGLKDMRSGEQVEVPVGELLDAVMHMHTRHAMAAVVRELDMLEADLDRASGYERRHHEFDWSLNRAASGNGG